MVEEKFVFTASRLTRGNFWFPVRIEINQERVARVKPRLVGANEESIPISKVASVNIATGLIWSDIRIDSSLPVTIPQCPGAFAVLPPFEVSHR